jgi:DNA primase
VSLDVLSFLQTHFDIIDMVPSMDGEYKVSPCPNCGNVKKKLYVNVESKVFHCFVCDYGRGHRIEKLFRDMGVSPQDYIIDDGIEDVFVETPKTILPSVPFNPKKLPEEFRFLIGNNSIMGKKALSYVRDRGINDNLIQEFKLGFCYDGVYKNRIIIPYYEEDLVYFVGRDFTESQTPKYLNPEWEKIQFLFNYERAKKDLSFVVIVEGVFDLFSLPNNSICLLGKFLSKQQIHLLRRFKQIYVALDSDALSVAYDLCFSLNTEGFTNLHIVKLPEGEDPGSLKSSFIDFVRRATPYNNLTQDSEIDHFKQMISSK